MQGMLTCTAFLVTACWLKPIANSMGHCVVQFTWLLLLSPALCLCSRASSLLPATAQANNAPAGQEFSTVTSACEVCHLHTGGLKLFLGKQAASVMGLIREDANEEDSCLARIAAFSTWGMNRHPGVRLGR